MSPGGKHTPSTTPCVCVCLILNTVCGSKSVTINLNILIIKQTIENKVKKKEKYSRRSLYRGPTVAASVHREFLICLMYSCSADFALYGECLRSNTFLTFPIFSY